MQRVARPMERANALPTTRKRAVKRGAKSGGGRPDNRNAKNDEICRDWGIGDCGQSERAQIITTHVRVIAPNAETAKRIYLKENPADRIKSVTMFKSLFEMHDSDFMEMAIEHYRHICDDNWEDIEGI